VAASDETIEVTGVVSIPRISGTVTVNLPADAAGDEPRIKYMLACAAAHRGVEVADVKITTVGNPT
jgi:hypothetical protein